MAVVNRNQKIWLNEAWKHYWSVLYSDGLDWCEDLESEIRKRLYQPEVSHGFVNANDVKQATPNWADGLNINFHGNFVRVAFQEIDFGTFSLFGEQIIPVLTNWANKNPLEKLGADPSFADRSKVECRDFINAVIRSCGNKIQNRLLQLLRQTEKPKFEIHCIPNNDDFGDEKKLGGLGIGKIARVAISENFLKDKMGLPIFGQVKLKKMKQFKSKVGAKGSFQKQDALLVEEMKRLLETGAENSVRQAANAVQAKAYRRGNSSDESVRRLLERGFSEKYPDYSNQKGIHNQKS